jgi:hypothetical protein
MTSLKVLLYQALRERGMTRAELMRRLDSNRESLDRISARPCTATDQIEAAFRALGKSVAVQIEVRCCAD